MSASTIERNSGPSVKTYEAYFDRRDYSNKDIKNREELNRYTTRQVETLLGERLNVRLSKNRYEIKNNRIFGKDMDEPFIDVVKRGRDYREKVGGEKRVDAKREQAEIDGFSFTQDILCNPDTPVGTMVLSVSPPGEGKSLYKHNFYDVFTLKKEKGEKFVEAKRYSSALTNKEYREKLKTFDPENYGDDLPATDDYLLSYPVVINNGFLKDAEEVHSYLHKSHKYMEDEDFEQVLKSCSPFINRYIKALSDNPNDVDRQNLILDAILNKADRVADDIKRSNVRTYDVFVREKDHFSLEDEIQILGRQEVRKVATGCGSSGGFSNNNRANNGLVSSPFSVSEFGSIQEWFECPKCRYKADGPVGNECPGCGLTKEDYAGEEGVVVCD